MTRLFIVKVARLISLARVMLDGFTNYAEDGLMDYHSQPHLLYPVLLTNKSQIGIVIMETCRMAY